jgi:hypothetical protein
VPTADCVDEKPIFTTEALRHGEEQNQPQITQTGADKKKRSLSRLNFREIIALFILSAFICAISGKSFCLSPCLLR